jgi:hypothetical protein
MEKPPSIAEMIEFEQVLDILGIRSSIPICEICGCHSSRRHAKIESGSVCRTASHLSSTTPK